MIKTLLEEVAQFDIFVKKLCIISFSVPPGIPGTSHTKPETDRINFLTQNITPV
jgi:hypothetical protein